jgi:hypothetical protein
VYAPVDLILKGAGRTVLDSATGDVSCNGIMAPLFVGSKTQRRRQMMAHIHNSRGGLCEKCKKPSDYCEWLKKDPMFYSWRKRRSSFEFHHTTPETPGVKLFRLGNIQVPVESHPELQVKYLHLTISRLKGCILLCHKCHTAEHAQQERAHTGQSQCPTILSLSMCFATLGWEHRLV